MSHENLSYQQTIEKMEREIKDMEDTVNGKKWGWFSTAARIVKYPVAAWLAAFSGCITASAIEMAGGGTISTTLALSSLSLPLGAAALSTIVTGTVVAMTFNYVDRFLQKRATKKLEKASEQLSYLKIDLIGEQKGKESIDFVFNQTYPLNESDQENVKPRMLSDDMCKATIRALKEKTEADFVLNKVDISDAQLKDNVLKNLLSGELGQFKTQHLILRNNQLTDRGIRYLGRYIRKHKAFQTLKSLDLSGNKLTSECLPVIYEIASMLKLEELDLSHNSFGYLNRGQKDEANLLDDFLHRQLNCLPFLKRLSLRNIGLSNKNKEALKRFCTGLNSIESLDLSQNAELEYAFFKDHLLKENEGLSRSLSLRELKTDYDNELTVNKVLAQNDALFMQAGHKAAEPRLLFLLRSFFQKIELPLSLKSKLQGIHLRTMEETVKSIKNNEAYAKNDALWLSVLKEKTEEMYLIKEPQADDACASSPVLCYQYQGQINSPSISYLSARLILQTISGLQLLFHEGEILIYNPRTSQAMNCTPAVSAQLNNKNCCLLPGQDDKGNRIAIASTKNKSSVLLKVWQEGEKSNHEVMDTNELPQVKVQINSMTESYEELALMPGEKGQEVVVQAMPRLAS